ncbi:MAG: metal ABC transporter solute-binding protein, Zn/Mn family [Helicobacteraceae bacterium]
MKKILFIFVLLASLAVAKPMEVSVSIVPQKSILEAIGGDLLKINTMVQPGNSPHTYEPRPEQMKALSKSKLYFAIGIEFENAWLDKFQAQNKEMHIVKTEEGIARLEMAAHHHDDEDEHEHSHDHAHGPNDPHVWTSPFTAKIIAKNMLNALVKADAPNAKTYQKNYKAFVAKLNEIDREIRDALKKHRGRVFAIYHPSWGYFAARYGLRQIPIEVEGKAPKPSETVKIIKFLKERNIKVLFTQKEFSQKSAEVIAKELGASVASVSPLSANYPQNLLEFARILSEGFSK